MRKVEFTSGFTIDENGEIRNVIKNKVIKPYVANNGYFMFSANKKCFLYHRVFAISFIPNYDCKPQINHKNGIKTDNRLENLEWCSLLDNIRHGFSNGLYENKGKNILQIKDGVVVAVYKSSRDAASHGYNRGHIGSCCRGVRKKHKGFVWKYEDDDSHYTQLKRIVEQYKDGVLLNVFSSISEAKRYCVKSGYGSGMSVYHVLRGKHKKGYGFEWKHQD